MFRQGMSMVPLCARILMVRMVPIFVAVVSVVTLLFPIRVPMLPQVLRTLVSIALLDVCVPLPIVRRRECRCLCMDLCLVDDSLCFRPVLIMDIGLLASLMTIPIPVLWPSDRGMSPELTVLAGVRAKWLVLVVGVVRVAEKGAVMVSIASFMRMGTPSKGGHSLRGSVLADAGWVPGLISGGCRATRSHTCFSQGGLPGA